MKTSVLRLVVLCLTVALSSTSLPAQTVNVTTWHNDIGRTGQNTSETTLTTALVGDDTHFGKLCSAAYQSRLQAASRCSIGEPNKTGLPVSATGKPSLSSFSSQLRSCRGCPGWPDLLGSVEQLSGLLNLPFDSVR